MSATLTPSCFGSWSDPVPFHLPMPGLFVDLEAGSGSVALTDEFLEAPPAVRVEVLQEWLRALCAHRDAAIVGMFREFAPPLGELTIVEQIEQFREHCNHKGISCPTELPLLLQRY